MSQQDKSHARAGKWWTKEDLDYLEASWGNIKKPVRAIAKKLQKSELAVIQKAIEIGLGGAKTAAEEHMTMNQVHLALKVDTKTIKGWVKEYGLHFTRATVALKQENLLIKKTALLKWLKQHQDLWDATKVEEFILGQEPGWLKEKRKRDREEASRQLPRAGEPWTDEEQRKMVDYYRLGYKIKEIAAKLGRTEGSLYQRIAITDVWTTGRVNMEKALKKADSKRGTREKEKEETEVKTKRRRTYEKVSDSREGTAKGNAASKYDERPADQASTNNICGKIQENSARAI